MGRKMLSIAFLKSTAQSRATLMLGAAAFYGFSLYVAATALAPVNGMHVWKQSDVYATILGFMGFKDYPHFALFDDVPTVYNIPFYTGAIAWLATTSGIDPLFVTTFFNLTIAILGVSGAVAWILLKFGPAASGIFLLTFSLSPLFLHYFSVPMPDVFGTVFGLLGFLILMWRGLSPLWILAAFPFFVLATLTKPVITFSLLVWYLVSLIPVARRLWASGVRSLPRKKLASLAILLTYLAILALLTERLRTALLGSSSQAILLDPGRYFGNLEIRLDPHTWITAWERLHLFGPGAWGWGIVLVTALVFVRWGRSGTGKWLLLGSWVSYVVGWLAFPLLYVIHDHYQIQHGLLFAVSLAAALKGLAGAFSGHRFLDHKNPIAKTTEKIFQFAVVPLSILVAYGIFSHEPNLSRIERVSFWSGVEFALRNHSEFLYVEEGGLGSSPVVGGLTSTKFSRVSAEDFAQDCELYRNRFDAFLFDGRVQCELEKVGPVSTILRDGDRTFILLDGRGAQ